MQSNTMQGNSGYDFNQSGIQGNNYQAPTGPSQYVPVQATAPTPKKSNKTGKVLTAVLSLLVVVTGAAGGYLYYNNYMPQTPEKTQTTSVLGAFNSSAYHAIFLTNGQVYFGKIESKNEYELILSDAHFLQVNTKVVEQQVPTGKDGETTTQKVEQPDLSIVDRMNTLHKPVGRVSFNMDNVMFTEELASDSSVVEAINTLKEQAKEEANKPKEDAKPQN